jgi:Disulphide bond corrector protein DsbC
MKNLLFAAAMAISASLAAQDQDPVKWTTELRPVQGSTNIYEMVFTATIESGWFLYSQHIEGEDGPIPTTFGFEGLESVEYLGYVEEKGKKIEGMDPVFQMKIVKYKDKVEYVQLVRIDPGTLEINCFVEYMTCNGELCLPPKEVELLVKVI